MALPGSVESIISSVVCSPGDYTLKYAHTFRGTKHTKTQICSPLNPKRSASCDIRPNPNTKPPSLSACEWIIGVMKKGGVVAAFPKTTERNGVVALDEKTESGMSAFWIENLLANYHVFNNKKNTLRVDTYTIEAITLQSKLPDFIPNGLVYGHNSSSLDEYIDGGVKVAITEMPYMNEKSIVRVDTLQDQIDACALELAHNTAFSSRGISPCLIAGFYSQRGERAPQNSKHSHAFIARERVDTLVLVSQISTFTLDDLMKAVKHAPVVTKRAHMENVLLSACEGVFKQIKEMCKCVDGFSTIKLNMTPETVVFSPKLCGTEDDTWRLQGVGYMPISPSYLDGEPKLTTFNAFLTRRISEDCHDFNLSFVFQSLILLAFTRAIHGPQICDIVFQHIRSSEDPVGFQASVAAISKNYNKDFFAEIAKTQIPATNTGMIKAVDSFVDDMKEIQNSKDLLNGRVCCDKPFFQGIVKCMISCSEADTRLFSSCFQDENEEMRVYNALKEVKCVRARRCLEMERA